MKKLTVLELLKPSLARLVSPVHLFQALQRQRRRKANRHVYNGAELKLYSQLVFSDFLHLGYFDNADAQPEDISINDIVRAQNRYAELLLQHVSDIQAPVLDVGCGMGGLCRMMLDRGLQPVALTPDAIQAAYVQARFPAITILQTKFERLDPAGHIARYGTVITSESLQYLKLDAAIPLMDKILKPGGKWIATDYFNIHGPVGRKSLSWDDFSHKIGLAGWRITHQQEITPNILPTLRFIHMWATRLGVPLMEFGIVKLQKKQPALAHLFEGSLANLNDLISHNIELIDPTLFAQRKSYKLLVLERGKPE